MMLFWTLSCLLAVATVNLVHAESNGVCKKCDTSNTFLEVADQMIKKAKACSGNKCDPSSVYLDVTELMTEKAKFCAITKCCNITEFLEVYTQMIKKAETCAHKKCDSLTVYLEVAEQMIERAKNKCNEGEKVLPPSGSDFDCSDVLRAGHSRSGVYKVWPRSRVMSEGSIDVYCDMDTDGGGWTVIQRRGNYSNPMDYFYKDWASYKKGFGYVNEDFWLGNDVIHSLSTERQTSVRFDLMDMEGAKKYAHYDNFRIDDGSNNYQLHVGNYSGNAGDSFAYHDTQMFTTRDRDNDQWEVANCAHWHKGGWWYKDCQVSNLNALYKPGKFKEYSDGVTWKTFKGLWECMQTAEIKLRPRDFRRKHPSGSSAQNI